MKNRYYWIIICLVLINCSGKKIIISEKVVETLSTQEITLLKEEIVSKYIIDELNYNYDNGNGTILDYKIENEYLVITRKHETRLSLMLFFSQQNIIYEEPDINSNELYVITENCHVNTFQIVFSKNLHTNEAVSWVKIITDDNIAGWLKVKTTSEIYSDGNWAILEIINVNNENWTVRKMNKTTLFVDFDDLNRVHYKDYQGIVLYDSIDIRNNPGINGTEVIFTLKMEDSKRVYFTILAITEEVDSIDGQIEHWLKIEFEDGRIGWIFGGYAGHYADPRYPFPNSIIGILLM